MPAGKQGSAQFSVLLVDGYDLLASKVKTFAWRKKAVQERSDGLGDSWEEHTPTGRWLATVTQAGAFFDTVAAGIHAIFSAAGATARLVMFAPGGNEIGGPFVALQGSYLGEYDILAKDGNLTKANATYQVSGQIDEGVIVQDWATKTVDWNTKTDGSPVDSAANPLQTVVPITSNSIANPTVVTTPVPHGLATGDIILISGVATSNPTINGERTVTVISPTTFSVPVNVTVAGTGGSFVRANSANGGVGYLGVSDFSGFTGFVGKIRDSADNVTFADLITFSNVTGGPVAERVTVAGVVDRYLSFDGNVTGAGSIKVFSGFKRN